MESPPQYSGAPKKSKTGLILGIVALGVVLCCCGGGAGLLFLGRGVMGKAFGLVECSVALSQQRDAVVAYAAKHGGKLPPSASWQNDIKPYIVPMSEQGKKGDLIHIPTVEEDVCDRGSGTSISYNAPLAGQKLDAVKNPDSTVLLFESPGKGRNKSAAWHEPDFTTSPVLLKTERRGWLRQPLRGQGFYKDKFGNNKPAPSTNGGASTSFGSVDVNSKPAKDGEGD